MSLRDMHARMNMIVSIMCRYYIVLKTSENICGDFNEISPVRSAFEHLVSRWWNCLERIMRFDLVEEVCPWKEALRFQKTHANHSLLSASCWGSRCELLVQASYCHVFTPPSLDSKPLKCQGN